MVVYQCPRCHYETIYKNDIRRHCIRKRKCNPIYSEVKLDKNDINSFIIFPKKTPTYKITQLNEELEQNNKNLEDENILLQQQLDEKSRKVEELNQKLNCEESSNFGGYIYIIQTREFIGKDIYKIGRTVNPVRRLTDYPKGSIMIHLSIVQCPEEEEKRIIDLFKNKFTHRNDYGKEYFQGNPFKMIQEFHNSTFIVE